MQKDSYFADSKKICEDHHRLTSYTSHIRIAGLPILPPLITDERRNLLLKYKHEAINVELELEKRRSVKHVSSNLEHDSFSESGLERLCNEVWDSSDNFSEDVNTSNIEEFSQNKNVSVTSGSDLNVSNNNSDSDKLVEYDCNGSRSLSLTDREVSKSSIPIKIDILYDKSISGHDVDSTDLNITDNEKWCVEGSSSTTHASNMSIANDEITPKLLPEFTGAAKAPVAKNEWKNLHLSPCKDLVLKCDIFTALNTSGVVCKKDKIDLNLQKNIKVDEVYVNTNFDNFNNRKVNNVKTPVKQDNVSTNTGNVDTTVKEIEISKSPPKLIRQNSYTLESPSPELLAFLEKQQKESSENENRIKRTETWTVVNDDHHKKSENFKPFYKCNTLKKSRKSWNIDEARQQWNKHNKSPSVVGLCESGKIEKHSKHKQKRKKNVNDLFVKGSSPEIDGVSVPDSEDRVVSESHIDSRFVNSNETDCKQCVSNEISIPSSLSVNDGCSNVDSFDSNLSVGMKCSTFRYPNDSKISVVTIKPEKDQSESLIFSGESLSSSLFVSSYTSGISKQDCSTDSGILTLDNSVLNKPLQKDSSVLLEDHNSYNDLRLMHHKQIEELLNRQEQELQMLTTTSDCVSLWSSPSAENRVSDSCGFGALPQQTIVSSPNCAENSPSIITILSNHSSLSTLHQKSPCIRRLDFSEKSSVDFEYSDKEQKAATIITAYVKGYLVRRLFKTERVREIIKSIIDSLRCALNLEADRNWTPSDMNLRERLLIQIEAAIILLHEIFCLPERERMAMIRADREKKKKQIPRLSSGSKPVLSMATQRTILRKQKEPQKTVIMKSASCIKPKIQKPRRRSHTVSGSSYSNTIRHPQTLCVQKSTSTNTTDRRPWK